MTDTHGEVAGRHDGTPPVGAASVLRFDHAAIAVRDLRRALALFRDVLGGRFIGGGDDPSLQIRTLQLQLPPGTKIELMQPLGPDSYLAHYIDRHGEGLHHITLFVEDVMVAVAAMEQAGFEVVDTSLGRATWHETFVRPSSGFGTLIQLAASELRWTEPIRPDLRPEDVIEGRVVWQDDRPYLREELIDR